MFFVKRRNGKIIMTQSFLPHDETLRPHVWTPTREAAHTRLQAFLPRAGQAYARGRNFDLGPGSRADISALSPWIRHRALLEEDVIRAVLERHGLKESEKFVQEVLWRGYFKGWLEHRPEVWERYQRNLLSYVQRLETDSDLSARYLDATSARTGIACFDTWAQELKQTGYLHNHARMWFASIWIYTLQLPWELGADFFYRHLLDGDPASNTCSWRWVCGLHTAGKTYLARPENIEKYTQSQFNPEGQLALDAPPLSEPPCPDPVMPTFASIDLANMRYGLVITEEDTSVDTLNLSVPPHALLAFGRPTDRSVLPMGNLATVFTQGLVTDGARHAEASYGLPCKVTDQEDWSAALFEWAAAHGLDAVVIPRLPIGPVRTRIRKAEAGLPIPIIEITRNYDQAVWPHARKGFFGLKKKIPKILEALGGV